MLIISAVIIFSKILRKWAPNLLVHLCSRQILSTLDLRKYLFNLRTHLALWTDGHTHSFLYRIYNKNGIYIKTFENRHKKKKNYFFIHGCWLRSRCPGAIEVLAEATIERDESIFKNTHVIIARKQTYQ